MQQYVRRAGRPRPERGADDRAPGEMRLHDLALEVLIEKIGATHGPEAQRVVHPLLAETVKMLAEIEQLA